MKKILVVALVIVVIMGIIWTWKPWEKLQEITGEEEGAEGEGEEVSGENQITGPVLFSYEASFRYLSSDDNGPIEWELFLIFPCPNIDNESVISNENITWQIWAYYEENDVPVEHLQMENNILGEFVPPRENAPWIPPPGVSGSSHGPEIWYQSGSALNFEENKPIQGAAALYQNEVYRIEAEFTVPGNQADEVTLVDNWGGVYFVANGYSGGTKEDYKPVRYSVEVSLSKWVEDTFEPLGTFSAIGDNPPRSTWVELSPK